MDKAFQHIAYLESNGAGKNLLALGCKAEIRLNQVENAFDKLRDFYTSNKGSWIIGFGSYDLKNGIEKLSSINIDLVKAPELHFFVPLYLFERKETEWKQTWGEESISIEACFKSLNEENKLSDKQPDLIPQISFDEYQNGFKQLQRHIRLGDVYEVNYCFELANKNVNINSWSLYNKLNELTKAPYSAYLKLGNIEVMCASPERFIRKKGDVIISQPIKGTLQRGINEADDLQLIDQLKNDPKELGENVMITDLVRNDLSKTASRGSVEVENLLKFKLLKLYTKWSVQLKVN